MATERRCAKERQQRADWFKHRLPAIASFPDRVVFIYDPAAKTHVVRQRGSHKRGERLTIDAQFGSWGVGHLALRGAMLA